MSEISEPNSLSRFLKHSSVYAIGNIANRVGAFVLLPLYTHNLTVAQYGVLEMFYITSDIIFSVLSAGLAHAALRFYFEYKDLSDRNKVISTCLLTTAAYSIPLVLSLSFWNAPLSRLILGTDAYASLFPFIYAIMILEPLRQIGLAYLRAKEYSTIYVGVSLLQLVIQMACNIMTVGYLHWGVKGILAGNLVSIAFGSAVVLWVTFRECGFGFDRVKLREIFKYSYPFIFTTIFSITLSYLDRILLRIFFSLEEVGIYSLAMKFGSLIHILLLEPFSRNFGAFRFSIMSQADAKSILVRVYHYLIVALCFLCLGVALYSREVLHIMSAQAYWSAYNLIPLMAISAIFGGSFYTFQTGLLYEKKTKYMMHISLISTVLSVLLYLVLIPHIFVYGATGAVILRSLVETFLAYSLSNRFYPIPYDLKRASGVVLVTVLLMGMGFVVPEEFSLWAALSLKAFLVCCFPLCLYLTVLVDKADVERGVSFIRRKLAPFFGAKEDPGRAA